jgi:hypothetical protein
MGVFKRLSDKRYRINYDVIPTNGKPRQIKTETLEGVNKWEAEAILAQRKAEVTRQREAIANGEQVKNDITLSTLFERFLRQKRKQKEENTIRRYETLVKLYLKPRFGRFSLGGSRSRRETGCSGSPLTASGARETERERTVDLEH